MKRILLITISALIGLNCLAQDRIPFPELGVERPDIDTVLNGKGKLLELDRDTVYIINAVGVSEYYRLFDNYNELYNEAAKLDSALQMMSSVQNTFEDYRASIDSLENKYELSLYENIRTAKLIREENGILQSNLDAVSNDLEKARRKLKLERWNKIGSKLLWGSGGLAAGVLIGGLLISVAN